MKVRALFAGLAFATLGAGALAQDMSWQEPLTARLLREQNCKVTFYTGIVERTVNGKAMIIAKAHCEDKRAFDTVRTDDFEPFTIKECQPAPTMC